SQCLSQFPDRLGEHARGDGLASPDLIQQLVMAQQLRGVVEQRLQKTHGHRPQRDLAQAADQLEVSGVKLESIESIAHGPILSFSRPELWNSCPNEWRSPGRLQVALRIRAPRNTRSEGRLEQTARFHEDFRLPSCVCKRG